LDQGWGVYCASLALWAEPSTTASARGAMAPKVRVAAAKAKAKAKAKARAQLPVVFLHPAFPVNAPVHSAVFSCDASHAQCIINRTDGQIDVNINGAAVQHMLNRPVTMAHPVCRLQEVNVPGSILGLGVGLPAPELPADCRWQLLGLCDLVQPGMQKPQFTVVSNTRIEHAQLLIQ